MHILEADVLIIGGGIAGTFAAVKAWEQGARVVIFEKANLQRSGAASVGILCWARLLREGATVEELADYRRDERAFWGEARVLEGLVNENLSFIGVKDGWDRVHDLESWGMNMRWDQGDYNIIPGYETKSLTLLRFHGADLKKKMAVKLRSLPITILERTMATDLLTRGGRVLGATGLNVRTGELVVCQAKATVLGTGKVSRLYNPRQGSVSGKYKMIGFYVGAGDGHAMAFRAGAELLNMEMAASNVRDLCSQYDWLSFHFGGFLHTAVPIVNSRGEKVCERFMQAAKLMEEERAGQGPCFWDPTGLSEEVHRDIEIAFKDERPIVARFAKQRGLDTRTHRYEVTTYKPGELAPRLAGVMIDEDARASLQGLYAAGDMVGGANLVGVPGAAVFGARAGLDAAQLAAKADPIPLDEAQVKAHSERALAPLNRKREVETLELEMKIRDIMERYCGTQRSEGSLKQGLWRLRQVKEKFLPQVGARNPHELMRALEVRSLFDLAELHLLTALERKESGLGNYRLDHPELRDAPWKEAIIARKEAEQIKLARRRMPLLKLK